MDLKQIRCFTVVAQEKNISRAAGRLHITQPALSRKIQVLEERLGVKLIERHGRGIRLTKAADELLPRFTEFVSRAEGIREFAGSLTQDPHQVIRIGATPHFTATLLSKALGPFIRRHSRVEVILTERPTDEFRTLLEHNDIHLAVGARRLGRPFHMRLLPPIPMLVVFPVGHSLQSRRSVELAEIVEQPLIMLKRGYLTREIFESACQLAHVIPTIKHESESLHTVLSLVGARYGVGIVPGNAHVSGRFASVLQDGRQITMDTAAVWNPHAHVPNETSDLLDALEETMQSKFEKMMQGTI